MRSFPEHWETVSLKEVVSYRKGKKPKNLSNTKTAGTVPYIDIKAFSTGEIRQYADIKSSNLTTKENVLVVWDGARSGLVGNGQEGAIGSTIMALRPIEINSLYLFRFLQTKYETINSNPRGTGIPHVDPELFWNMNFPIAPLNEQHRIVAKLEKLLAKVEACQERLNKIPTLLKRFRQSVLAAACSGRLTADWRKHQQIESSSPSQELTDDLPDSWTWEMIRELASSVKGAIQSGPFGSSLLHSEFQSTGILVIGIDNVLDGKFSSGRQHRISSQKYEALKKYTARPLDVLVTVMATVGRCCVVPADIETAIITKHVYRITINQTIVNPYFLMHCIRGCPAVLAQIQGKIQGVTRPGINGTILKEIRIPLPPIAEQHEIIRRIEALFKSADQIEERYKKAKAYVDRLIQSILAKAFRGELVPQDPNDEPAYVLLRKIEKSPQTVYSCIKSSGNKKRS